MGTPRPARRRWFSLVTGVVASSVAVALIISLPRYVGATWPQIGNGLRAIPVPMILGLAALWFAGLLVHVPVLKAAMPSLTTRQALTLNLSGSAVSNILPVGGPAGMGLGYAMARSWGFRADQFASFTVITNLWNALGKFFLSLLVLAVAATLGLGLPTGVVPATLAASGFVAIAAGAAFSTFRTESASRFVGRRLDWTAGRLGRKAAANGTCEAWLLECRQVLLLAVRSGWKRMTLGVSTYLFLQAALLYACLAAAGATATVSAVAVAFAIERLISLAPITPGAAGVAEFGTIAALHALGVDTVAAATGVLLYRILMFAIEIPIGGLLALLWFSTGRVRRPASPPPTAGTPPCHETGTGHPYAMEPAA